MANVYMRLHIHVTIFSAHGKFQLVSNIYVVTRSYSSHPLLTILYHHLVLMYSLDLPPPFILLLIQKSSELLYILDT